MNEVNHDEVRGVGCEFDEHRARRWGGTTEEEPNIR